MTPKRACTIVNFYIEVPLTRELDLKMLLINNGFAFYDATEFDSLTSGHQSFNTLEEIEAQIEGK